MCSNVLEHIVDCGENIRTPRRHPLACRGARTAAVLATDHGTVSVVGTAALSSLRDRHENREWVMLLVRIEKT